MTSYVPIKFAVVLILCVVILWAILYSKNEQFKNTITKFMDDIPDVPTIKLIDKNTGKNIIQKILGNVNNARISFKISHENSEYSVIVPSYNDYNFAGKGLVIAASGNKYRYLTGLYSNLYVIRKFHKSNIPIEIFYIGKSEEFKGSIKNMILELGNIKIYNLKDRIDTNCTEDELRGYQTKPLAALCSSFQEIIIMDADALCFIDPYYFFMAEGYENFGMILFKDYVDCMSFISRDFMETIGIGVNKYCEYTNDYEIDSSCVVMNKEKYWDALFTTCIINVKSDSYHKSKNVLGDKDTWVLAAMFLGLTPYISRPPPNTIITNDSKVLVGHFQSTIFTSNNDSEEIFTHYNNQKIDLLTVDLTGWTYAEIKNPKSGTIYAYGNELPEKVIETFKHAKKALNLLYPHIPDNLKTMVSVDGVSKNGFIP